MPDTHTDHAADRLTASLEAASAAFGATAGPDLPPLYWRAYAGGQGLPGEFRGQVTAGQYGEQETADVLQAWADRLGLERAPGQLPGSTEYRRMVQGWSVVVWGITDVAAWSAGVDQ